MTTYDTDNDRTAILAAIKNANHRHKKIFHPGVMPPPKKASLKGKARIEQFISAATAQFATISEVKTFEDVPPFLNTWLKRQNLPSEFVLAPILAKLNWGEQKTLSPSIRPAVMSDVVGVSLAYGAAAETGSVMMISGHDTPTTLNFVPDVEVILLSKGDISAGMEGCWERLRGLRRAHQMPRAVNFITGPSRTADVEATMVLGAHGPRRLHIVLVDEDSPWQNPL